ncbi:fused MFS/spermidine synthase [Ilumatobacter sp.]|uniref:fused MFS/spermidine synthase n=1 Tax=Ilumatobacter sp. TaxID=1967498 RepID=UPI003AF72241
MRGTSRQLPDWFAIALVTGTSAAVLVLEILAGRVLAPYVGVNLETYTAIIGTILAGIALGARLGGAAADRHDPRRLIPLLLVVGGALAMSSIPIVRVLGGSTGAGGRGAPSVLLAAAAFLPSAAVLSAVPPAVIKLQLRDLEETGHVVGRLSAWSTAGAIAGTFIAGFVLVAYAAVSTLIVSVGVALVAAGALMAALSRRTAPRELLAAGGLVAVAVGGVALVEQPCDVQSGYYCISITTDPDRADGRVLELDDLRHSYVALDDPAHLEFWYVRRIVGAIETLAPAGDVDVIALGGGAMTVPRYLATTRPGSRQIVLEIDPDLVDVVEDEFGLPVARDRIIVGDGRVGLRALPDDSADVIVGDAFGSRAVPWHLATEEFMADIERVLRPGGIYVANMIDGPGESFLRAETATIRTSMPFVGVMRSPDLVGGFVGNAVAVASTEPLDLAAWDAERRRGTDAGALVDDVDAYLDGALVLTDDFAPVDQLIAGAR